MKKILLFAFLLTAGHLFAQDASRVSLFKVSDGFVQSGGSFDGGFGYGGYYEPYYSSFGGPYGGGYGGGTGTGSLADFKALAPNSALLNRDLTGYSSGSGYFGGDGSNINFSALLGLQLRNAEGTGYRKSPLIRIGVTYGTANLLNYGLYNSTSTRIDTLTSSQTGQVTYVDSIWSSSYNMNYYSEQIRLDASMIFRTNPEARWSAYGGLGVTAGMSINAYTTIDYSEYSYGSSYSSFYYGGNGVFSSETIRNKTNFGFSTYIPVGVDFRVGNKREFWKHIHLYYEWRPQIDVTVVPEVRTVSQARVQSNLGLRINW
jgi:hypothetical protein